MVGVIIKDNLIVIMVVLKMLQLQIILLNLNYEGDYLWFILFIYVQIGIVQQVVIKHV